ncbi:MAG: AbrB/MazE/SpoVT family DNA-binding domain-containing protein [Candidatus Dormibacteraceae bacterium]
MIEKVRKRRRGFTHLTAKYQLTIPRAAADLSGFHPGDDLRVEAAGEGQILLIREQDPIEALVGIHHYPKNYIQKLRAEWE